MERSKTERRVPCEAMGSMDTRFIVGCVLCAVLLSACSPSIDPSGAVATTPPLQTAQDSSLPTVPDSEGASLPTVPGGQTSDTFAVAPGSTTTLPSTTTTSTTTTSTTTTTLPPVIEIIPSDVLFETGKWVLRQDAEDALRAVAEDIEARAPNATLRIVGHTDSRGSDQSNQQLSELRAASVATWFVEWGFVSEHVMSEGKGESMLVRPDVDASGDFIPEAGALNRRVEIFVAT